MNTALVRRIETFLRKTGMKPSRLGREAVNDPALISNMKKGRQLRPLMEARLSAWLNQQESTDAHSR